MASYIISGGGTGGHIYPAIAIAQALQQLDPAAQILFVGAEGKMEMRKVPEAGYEIIGLPVAGIQRRFTPENLIKNLVFPFKLISSLLKARKVLKTFRPQVVIGVGGYASGPVLQQAQWMGIPTLIQEQNSYAGLTNKQLAAKAKAICVAYPDMEAYFPKEKIIFTGNPLRSSLKAGITTQEEAASAREKLGLNPAKGTFLIMGGSLGARTLNEALLIGHGSLLNSGYQIIWQTGANAYEQIKTSLELEYNKTLPTGLLVLPFLTDMQTVYAASTVVVSRAGALSISELALVQKPCILVPSPNVTADHQTQNAKALVNVKAALMVADAQASTDLVPKALALLDDDVAQTQLSQAIGKLAKPTAALEVATVAGRLAGVIK